MRLLVFFTTLLYNDNVRVLTAGTRRPKGSIMDIKLANPADRAKVAALLAEQGIAFSFGDATSAPSAVVGTEGLEQLVGRLEGVAGFLSQRIEELQQFHPRNPEVPEENLQRLERALDPLTQLQYGTVLNRLEAAGGQIAALNSGYGYGGTLIDRLEQAANRLSMAVGELQNSRFGR